MTSIPRGEPDATGKNRPHTEREASTCSVVVASGPAGLLHAVCGHPVPCSEHDYRPPVLADLLRHAAALRVLRDPASTAAEREEARSVLGLSTPPNGSKESRRGP